MVQGQLIVAQEQDGINILGVADLDPALKPLVGTGETKEATTLTGDQAADQLEAAITKHIRGGERIIDGYVKFARPIKVTGTAAGKEALAELLASSDKKRQEKQASAPVMFTIESPLHEYLDLLAAGELEKAAAHPFNDSLINAMTVDDDKVDPAELGFPVGDEGFPVNAKIKFANKEAEDLFRRAFKMSAEKRGKKAASSKAASEFIKAAQSPIADVVAAVKADPKHAIEKIAGHLIVALKKGDKAKVTALATVFDAVA